MKIELLQIMIDIVVADRVNNIHLEHRIKDTLIPLCSKVKNLRVSGKAYQARICCVTGRLDVYPMGTRRVLE